MIIEHRNRPRRGGDKENERILRTCVIFRERDRPYLVVKKDHIANIYKQRFIGRRKELSKSRGGEIDGFVTRQVYFRWLLFSSTEWNHLAVPFPKTE